MSSAYEQEAFADYLRTRAAVIAANGGSPRLSIAGLLPDPPMAEPWEAMSAAVASSASPSRFICTLWAELVLCAGGECALDPRIELVGFLGSAGEPVDPWLLLAVAARWSDSSGGKTGGAAGHLGSAMRLWLARGAAPLRASDIRVPRAVHIFPFTREGRVPRAAAVDRFLEEANRQLVRKSLPSASVAAPAAWSEPELREAPHNWSESPYVAVRELPSAQLPQQVYELGPDWTAWGLEVVDPADQSRVEALGRGERYAGEWTPVAVKPLEPVEPRAEGLQDLVALAGDLPVFSHRAVEVLRDLLAPHGELCPLAGLPYVAYNVTRVLDALDESRAGVHRISGLVVQVERVALRGELVRDVPIFRLATIPQGRTFVNEAFRARVRDAGLTGFGLKPVWPIGGAWMRP